MCDRYGDGSGVSCAGDGNGINCERVPLAY